MGSNLVEGDPAGSRPAWVGLLVREIFTIGIAVALYVGVRAIIGLHTARAFVNAREVIRFEQVIGLFHEPAMQHWMVRTGWLEQTFNEIYVFGLWPVIIATLIWLLRSHREEYFIYRDALLISGAIGLVVFLFYPVAPPRFLPQYGFIDTVTLHTHAYRLTEPPSVTNIYAAMPSMHVGWNLLMGIAIFRHARRWPMRVVAIIMPLVLWASTVLTANHLLLDGIAGAVVIVIGLVLAKAWAARAVDLRGSRSLKHGQDDEPTDHSPAVPASD